MVKDYLFKSHIFVLDCKRNKTAVYICFCAINDVVNKR